MQQRPRKQPLVTIQRASPMVAALVLVIGLSMLLAACGQDDGTSTGETGTTATTAQQGTTSDGENGEATDIALEHQCYNEESGLSVDYPEGWHTNEQPEEFACRYFHPEEFEVDEAGDAPDAVIRMRTVGGTPEQNAEAISGGQPEESREERQVGGRDAIVTEHVSTGDDLLPEGTRTKRYLVDLNGTTLIAAARDVEGVDYDETQSVLEEMIGTVEMVHAG